MTNKQINELNAIANECHERDPELRARLSGTDFADWANDFDRAGMDDLAARVREVFVDD